MVQREAVNWLLILVPVVATAIIVCVLLFDHLAFLIVEQLHRAVHLPEPRVLEDLSYGEALLRVDLEEASKQVSCFK